MMEDQEDVKLENTDEVQEVNEEISKTTKETDHDEQTYESEAKAEEAEVVSNEAKSSVSSGITHNEAVAVEVIRVSAEEEEEEEEEGEKVGNVCDIVASVSRELVIESSLEKKNEEIGLPISNTNKGKSSEVSGSVSKGDVAGHGGVSKEVSEIPRSSENQPFVAATPQQLTCWMNCCGLLDFLKHPSQ